MYTSIELCKHEHIIFDNYKSHSGSINFMTVNLNIGFGSSGLFRETDLSNYEYYDEHYDDEIMLIAVNNLIDGDIRKSPQYGKEYEFIGCNCQDFVQSVIDEYNQLIRNPSVKQYLHMKKINNSNHEFVNVK